METKRERKKVRIRDGLARQNPILDTEISSNKGDINIRGYSINELLEYSNFEEAAYLVLNSELPNQSELEKFNDILVSKREIIPKKVQEVMGSFDGSEHPLNVIAACFSTISSEYAEKLKDSHEGKIDHAMNAISLYPVILAQHIRKRNGAKIEIIKKPELDHANNFIYESLGTVDKKKGAILNTILVGGLDMVLSPSTTAGRVTASTRSDFFSCMASSILAWKGYRHGAACEFAFRDLTTLMDDKIDTFEFYDMKNKSNIPSFGFGHPIYKKGDDPRVKKISPMAEFCYQNFGGTLYKKLQDVVLDMKKRNIHPNPNIYLASIIDSLGFPAQDAPSISFMGRVAGVSAHIIEESGPMRAMWVPKAHYNGIPNREYIPMEKRLG
ncbi:hypothetical protein CL615_02850 [archaeon]|jgi:citrate synthase|nr:hypothetical protein [archaeon]MDP6547793.1 citrate/2-methylcitrate synthase [Candidatus Woesearchaeota archaeon]|tara:strand:- start:6695 stop:7846 length:1152 start_codon:yes stop_codon:yes gene_type:complete